MDTVPDKFSSVRTVTGHLEKSKCLHVSAGLLLSEATSEWLPHVLGTPELRLAFICLPDNVPCSWSTVIPSSVLICQDATVAPSVTVLFDERQIRTWPHHFTFRQTVRFTRFRRHPALFQHRHIQRGHWEFGGVTDCYSQLHVYSNCTFVPTAPVREAHRFVRSVASILSHAERGRRISDLPTSHFEAYNSVVVLQKVHGALVIGDKGLLPLQANCLVVTQSFHFQSLGQV